MQPEPAKIPEALALQSLREAQNGDRPCASRRLVEAAAFFSVLAAVAAAFLAAVAKSHDLDYIAINGTFQNYNPLHRILLGQIPGKDFTIYLGFGPTLSMLPGFLLSGGTYKASIFSSVLATGLAWTACLHVVLRLAGVDRPWAAILSTAAYCLSIPNHPIGGMLVPDGVQAWTNMLLDPADSAIGLRSAAIPLALGAGAALCAAAPRFFSSRAGGAAVGGAAGAILLWSNDCGPPAGLFLALFGFLGPFCHSGGTARPEFPLQRAGLLLLCAAATPALLLLSVLGADGTRTWAMENFIDIAGAQRWYFTHEFDQKIFDLPSVRKPVETIFGVLLSTYYAQQAFRMRRPRFLALSFLLGATLASAHLATIAGTGQDRYFIGFERCYHPAAAIFLLQFAAERRPGWFLLRKSAWTAAAAALCACSWIGAAACVVEAFLLPFEKTVEAAELGGSLGPMYRDVAETAHRIGREADAAGIPANRRIYSTYSSGFDALAGALHPTRTDYIIHVLGRVQVSAEIQSIREDKIQWATTINHDTVGWQPWLERESWPIHREILLAYRPVANLGMIRLWERRDVPVQPLNAPLECAVEEQIDGSLLLKITGGDPALGTAHSEIEIQYRSDVEPSGLPWIGRQGILGVEELASGDERGFGDGEWAAYALPIDGSAAVVGLPHDPKRTSVLKITAWPEGRARIRSLSCRAKAIIPLSETEPLDQRRMAVHTEAKARHLPDRNAGVPILRSLGLSLPMEARTQTLRIGDRVFSECTGPMRVMSVDAFWHSSASVWLVADGPDLHPPEQGVRLSMFEDLDKAACVLKTFPITITPGAVEATPRGANP